MKKGLEDKKLKQAKLAKTRGRRERLARERRSAENASGARRNDLLPAVAVELVPLAELSPPPRRTRRNDPEQTERLVQSIANFGFTLPILIRGRVVLDGWQRVLAARKLDLEQVIAIDCNHLSDAEARALALAANRLGERGEWDLEQLKLEFEELIELEINLDLTGFSMEDQDIILLDGEEDDPASKEEEAVDEPPEVPVTQPGDIWELGAHRVICGNALEQQTYDALLEGETVHSALTDPPYNVKIKHNVSGLGKTVHDEFVMASGELSDEEFLAFLTSVMTLMTSVLVSGAVLFAFMDWRSIHRLYAAGEAAGLKLINLAVWYKEAGGMGALYRSAHELVAVFCNGAKPRVNNVALGKHGRDRTNVWLAAGANRRGSSASEMLSAHATPKPVELCVDALLDVTERGEIVLDAFLGSGTTLIAAEKTGRQCRGIELAPGFVDVTVRRWERLTGQEAVLAATGETFAEVLERRSEQGSAADQPPSEGDVA